MTKGSSASQLLFRVVVGVGLGVAVATTVRWAIKPNTRSASLFEEPVV